MEENQWGDAQTVVAGGLFGLYEYEELKQKKKTLIFAQLQWSGNWQAWQKAERSPACFWVELGLLRDRDSSQWSNTYHIFTKLLGRIFKVLIVKLRSRSHVNPEESNEKLDLFKVWPQDVMTLQSSWKFSTGAALVQVECHYNLCTENFLWPWG